jgi:phosphate acetyltransferase
LSPDSSPHFGAHPRLEALVQRACARPYQRTAIVYPTTVEALSGALVATDYGLIEPHLVGPRAAIERVADAAGLSLADCSWTDTPDDPATAATTAVALARRGEVSALMKGSLHTEDLLRAVIARHEGLRVPGRQRRLSHVFWMDVPSFDRPLLLTDCVVNVAPTLTTRRDIAQNAFDLARVLNIENPHLAVVSATETHNYSLPATIDADELKAMAARGEITGGTLDGPFAFDLCVSPDAARIKGVHSPVAGHGDILLMPGIEAGNIVYKALIYLADALCAGVIVGTSVPVILTSRADSIASRVGSCALASIQAAAAAALDG